MVAVLKLIALGFNRQDSYAKDKEVRRGYGYGAGTVRHVPPHVQAPSFRSCSAHMPGSTLPAVCPLQPHAPCTACLWPGLAVAWWGARSHVLDALQRVAAPLPALLPQALSPYAAAHALTRSPSPLAFLSYLFGCGNLLTGPFMEFTEYCDFIDLKGVRGAPLCYPMLQFTEYCDCIVLLY
jgi:hypothetical protein